MLPCSSGRSQGTMKLVWKCFTLSTTCFFVLFFINAFYTTQEFDSNVYQVLDIRKARLISTREGRSIASLHQMKDRALVIEHGEGMNQTEKDRRLVSLTPGARPSGPKPAGAKPQMGTPHEPYVQRANYFHSKDYGFIIENPDLCTGTPVYILFFVQSAVDHLQTRDKIRRTWGSVREYNGYNLQTVFMLAKPVSEKLQQEIFHESETNGDILQMDFVDNYRNLTLKHVMSLGWIAAHCSNARYVTKVDDDTIVNVYQLLDFLSVEYKGDAITNHIYCSVYGNMSPRRDRTDKWYVSEAEYPYKKYPPYCEGFAYVTGPSVTNALYTAAPLIALYWIDDVYVTGMLMQKVGLGHRQFRRSRGYTVTSGTSCRLGSVRDALFQLQKYDSNAIDWDSCWRNMQAAAATS